MAIETARELRKATRDRILGVATWGCLGGFLVSSLGAYVAPFADMDLIGAGLAAVAGSVAHAR